MNIEQTVNDKDTLRVVDGSAGTFDVVLSNDIALATGFTTHADAWAWIDRHTREGRADTDRHHRIRQSTSFS